MNQAIKTQWVAALRSRDYKQGRHLLNSADGFCCLGVLCDLAVKAGVADWGAPATVAGIAGVSYDYVRKCDNKTGVLPEPVQEWAGLETANPWLWVQRAGDVSMARANDSCGLSFPELADLIEVQL
jgi:hypothetical protein